MVAITPNGTALENGKALNWIREWGGGPSTEALYEPGCHLFTAPGLEGLIGFRVMKGRAVVIGDPVCPPENRAKLTEAFHEHCRHAGMKIIYMLVSESFANWAIQNGCPIMLEACDDLVFDPFRNPTLELGAKARRLRNMVRFAQSHDLSAVEYTDFDPKLEEAMQQVGDNWLKERKGLQIHLGLLKLFIHRLDSRWFYIKDPKGNILAVALLRRLGAKKGWFIKFLIKVPAAPRGTSELLMTSILEALREEGCHYASVGAVVADQIKVVNGLGKFGQAFVHRVFSLAKRIFHLDQRKVYWEKYSPTSEPTYLLFSGPRVGFKDILALMKILNVRQ